MKGIIISITAVVLVGVSLYFIWAIRAAMRVQMNTVQIMVPVQTPAPGVVPGAVPFSLKVAVIGDAHVRDTKASFAWFRGVLQQVQSHQPDLILSVGDYVSNRAQEAHDVVLDAMREIAPIPHVAVLGNHDWGFRHRDRWQAFEALGLIENQVRVLEIKNRRVCIRAIGDVYSGYARYIEFPSSCAGLPQITVTHDPMGAFYPSLRGLVFAGHTHCGQVRLPLVGPLWVPTRAPNAARCGLYRDEQRTVFVTSGVGTSILPIRYGAQAQWDLIELTFVPGSR
ncbi:MAG: metallophosphoesterase [Pseudomonadota bacterium]